MAPFPLLLHPPCLLSSSLPFLVSSPHLYFFSACLLSTSPCHLLSSPCLFMSSSLLLECFVFSSLPISSPFYPLLLFSACFLSSLLFFSCFLSLTRLRLSFLCLLISLSFVFSSLLLVFVSSSCLLISCPCLSSYLSSSPQLIFFILLSFLPASSLDSSLFTCLLSSSRLLFSLCPLFILSPIVLSSCHLLIPRPFLLHSPFPFISVLLFPALVSSLRLLLANRWSRLGHRWPDDERIQREVKGQSPPSFW